MPIQNQSEDHNLISTEEAKLLIDLYANREKQRLAEAERIAEMPKLSDIATLLNMSVDDLRPMLSQVYMGSPIPLTLDANGEEHLSDFDANNLIAYASDLEEEQQKELERKASMTSVQEMAVNLGISEEEAAALLKEVRDSIEAANVRTGPPPILEEEEPEPEPEYLYDRGQNGYTDTSSNFESYDSSNSLITAETKLAIFVGGILLVIVLLAALGSRKSAAPVYSYPPYSETYGRTYGPSTSSWSPPYVTRTETPRPSPSNSSMTNYNSPLPPHGWTVKVYGRTNMISQTGAKGEKEPKLAVEALLRESIRAMVNYQGPSMQTVGLVQTAPLSPVLPPTTSSDLNQWITVVVTDGNVVRRAYIKPRSSANPQENAEDFERRLDYLVGKTSQKALASRYPSITVVSAANSLLPKDFRLTLMSGTQFYQSAGSKDIGRDNGSQELVGSIEDATTKLLQKVEGKSDSAYTLELSYPGGCESISVGDYLKALRTRRAGDLSMAASSFHNSVETAVARYQSQPR